LAVATAALALSGCLRESDTAFGERVRAYLMAHPEVLQEASQRLQDDEEAKVQAGMRKAETQLPALRAAIERDPGDFVANPNGKITITEFYDYRCPHCIHMAPGIVALIKTHPDVRFVFKEMPIFGADSIHAANAALAVKKSGGDYLGLYQGYMSAQALDDSTINRIALAHGAKEADIPPSSANTAQLARNKNLFDKLGMDGTPGFVVGNHIFTGEPASGDPVGMLNAAVASAEKSPAA
jgi:protein-disulfide isomerase